MAEYDIDFLISLIEERPVLWDTSDEHNKNKFNKQDAWKSVCESLFPNFQDKENSEKTKLGKYFYTIFIFIYNNTINAYKYELNSVRACKRATGQRYNRNSSLVRSFLKAW